MLFDFTSSLHIFFGFIKYFIQLQEFRSVNLVNLIIKMADLGKNII